MPTSSGRGDSGTPRFGTTRPLSGPAGEVPVRLVAYDEADRIVGLSGDPNAESFRLERPLGPLEPCSRRPEPELERDPVGARLGRVRILLLGDRLQPAQDRARPLGLRSQLGHRCPPASSSQRKKSRSVASLRTVRDGSVSLSQRRTLSRPAFVISYGRAPPGSGSPSRINPAASSFASSG